jgi:hypothetical protein
MKSYGTRHLDLLSNDPILIVHHIDFKSVYRTDIRRVLINNKLNNLKMIKVTGRKVEFPNPGAFNVNANKNGNYTKGGYALNRNGVPLNTRGVNALKGRLK